MTEANPLTVENIEAELAEVFANYALAPRQLYVNTGLYAQLLAHQQIRFDLFDIRRWFRARKISRELELQHAWMSANDDGDGDA